MTIKSAKRQNQVSHDNKVYIFDTIFKKGRYGTLLLNDLKGFTKIRPSRTESPATRILWGVINCEYQP